MKKWSMFKKGLLIYVAVLVLIVVGVDIYIWSKLSDYEKTMQAKDSERQATNSVTVSVTPEATDSPEVTPTPVPTEAPSPTPTPEPVKIAVELPDNVVLYVDETAYDLSAYESTETDNGCFEILYTFSEEYSEYSDIKNRVEIPSLKRYELEIPEESVISVKDTAGQDVELKSETDENGMTVYSCGFISKNDNYETISALAFEAIKKYALFCANDAQASELAPYFPAGSEYLQVISSLDNSWYMRHTGLPSFSEETVIDYLGYSDSLVYIEISMKQTILSSITGTYVDSVITHPVWFVKLDGEWKIGAIEF